MADSLMFQSAGYFSLKRVVLAYAAAGSAWAMLADLLVMHAAGVRGGAVWLTLTADLAFVLVSATLLYLCLRQGGGRDVLAEPAPRGSSRPWGMYVFAALSSAAMVLLNDKVGQVIGQRSVLMLSIYPIVFSAYAGGFGPGLVATLVPALLADFLAPQPDTLGSLQSTFGLRQVLLISTGTVVSALMSRLHGATQRAKTTLKELSVTSAQLSALNQDLERRVALRTAALSAANEELDSFAFAVSHDLRVPLRTMTGLLDVMKEDHAAGLTDEARRCLGEIQSAGDRMSGLIGGLLSLSQDASLPLQDDDVDLSAIAGVQLAELAGNEPDRHVRCEIEQGITTRGDARLLASALQNLLGNAWKYTAHRVDASVTVRSVWRDGQCWLSIEDDGQGFSPEHAASLFRPFYRAHTAEQYPGLGIGLATVRRIVQRHGGLIECEGRPGEGATFRFTLPALTSRTA